MQPTSIGIHLKIKFRALFRDLFTFEKKGVFNVLSMSWQEQAIPSTMVTKKTVFDDRGVLLEIYR